MRVAYFPDSFHEINGVAHTSRQFEAFAQRHDLPFLSVRAGDRSQPYVRSSRVASLELKRGFFSFALEKDLRIDLGFLRHLPLITRTVRDFKPDIIHITGPSELGFIGAFLALWLRIPLVASWHTNVHEYAAKRSSWFLRFLPVGQSTTAAMHIRQLTLAVTARFYKRARILFAPNVELCRLLERKTGRPCRLMPRGVTTELFSPDRRDRREDDGQFVLGFVGRLSVEKNVALLKRVGEQLDAAGLDQLPLPHHRPRRRGGLAARKSCQRPICPECCAEKSCHAPTPIWTSSSFRRIRIPSATWFSRPWLPEFPQSSLPTADPRHIVRDGETGIIAEDEKFAAAVASVLRDPARHARMREAARQYALSASWDAVFEGVYSAYESVLVTAPRTAPIKATL